MIFQAISFHFKAFGEDFFVEKSFSKNLAKIKHFGKGFA